MQKEGLNTLIPYLTFNGNCKEAMEFYASVLGAELSILPFRGSPAEKDVPEEYKDKVMHARLKFENIVFFASDTFPDREVKHGSNIALSIAATEREQALKFFDKLSDGGKVIMPFEKAFWGAEFGMCIDRFGFQWMVDYELPQED